MKTNAIYNKEYDRLLDLAEQGRYRKVDHKGCGDENYILYHSSL